MSKSKKMSAPPFGQKQPGVDTDFSIGIAGYGPTPTCGPFSTFFTYMVVVGGASNSYNSQYFCFWITKVYPFYGYFNFVSK